MSADLPMPRAPQRSALLAAKPCAKRSVLARSVSRAWSIPRNSPISTRLTRGTGTSAACHRRMIAIAFLFVCLLCDCFKSRRRLEAEILVLRHQLNVVQQRAPRRLHLRWADRALFIWLYRRCPRILDAVRPETVVRW